MSEHAYPIRIAHLIHTMAHGGVETALINWMKTFDRSKVVPHLLCFANPGNTEQPFVDAAMRAGFEVRRIPWSRYKPVFRAARATAEYLRQHQIELLHCHNAYADAVGLLAARLMRASATPVKTVTTVYVWSQVGTKRRILQWLDERLLPHFDQLTAHCQAALDDTANRGIARAENIRLLTCGFADRVASLTKEQRAAGRTAMGVKPDETVLINVSRFWPEKRHDVLLDAFALLRARVPRVRLWVPGVGPEEPRIRELVAAKRLGDAVDFLGFRTDLPELLALADIQVHTSDEEGVPLAILAGMAAGRPIVATRVGGIAEVMVDGQSGFLVPRREPARIADAIAFLMANPDRAQALGRTAQRFIETDYSLAAATARVEKLYADVLRADVSTTEAGRKNVGKAEVGRAVAGR
jgi:glycosyltransferase involved in cell wall biosynthesis